MSINTVVKRLKEGAVIAYPTEGVWGLGCDPANQQAVLNLLELKQRPIDKGVILVADKIERFKPYLRELPLIELPLINRPLLKPSSKNIPGVGSNNRAITWIVEHGGMAPDWLSGSRSNLAIRVSNHPTICEICEAADMPLVSTSANPSGLPSAITALQVQKYFGNLIKVIVPGELGGQNGASEIRDFATGKILRESES